MHCSLVVLVALCAVPALAQAQTASAGQTTPGSTGSVTVVTTFQELFDAWSNGAPHIELRAHMDSTPFPLLEADIQGNTFRHVLPPQKGTTKSIRGNCTNDVPPNISNRLSGPELLQRKPKQCLILAHTHLMPVVTGAVWVDNIFLRFAHTFMDNFGGEEVVSALTPSLFHSHGGSAYVTNLTVQGDAVNPSGALVVYSTARLLFADCIFDSQYAHKQDDGVKKPAALVKGSSVAYLRTVASNTVQDQGVPIFAGDSWASLRFQQVTFENIPDNALRVQVVSGAQVFMDDPNELVYLDGGEDGDLSSERPQTLAAADATGLFLSEQDAQFMSLKESAAIAADPSLAPTSPPPVVTPPATPTSTSAPPATTPTTGSGGSSNAVGDDDGFSGRQRGAAADGAGGGGGAGDDTPVIAAAAGSVAAVVCVAILGMIFVRWRRGQNTESAAAKMPGGTGATGGTGRTGGTGATPPNYHNEAMYWNGTAGGMGGMHYSGSGAPGGKGMGGGGSDGGFSHRSMARSANGGTGNGAAWGGAAPEATVVSTATDGSMFSPPISGRDGVMRRSHNGGGGSMPHLPPGAAAHPLSGRPISGHAHAHANGMVHPNDAGMLANGGGGGGGGSMPHLSGADMGPTSSGSGGMRSAQAYGMIAAQAYVRQHSQPQMYGNHGGQGGQMGAPVAMQQPPPGVDPRVSMHSDSGSASGHGSMISARSDRGAMTRSTNMSERSARAQFNEIPTRDSLCGTLTQTVLPEPPADDAPVEARKEHLERQLDSLVGSVVLGTLTVLGNQSRLCGGQAVVQVVEDRRSNARVEYAIKFFLSPTAFAHEKALYTDPNGVLGHFLPQMHSIVERSSGQLRDAYGGAMPSAIVMEKGDALDQWRKSGAGIDMITGLQVLYHVAERLRDLHAAGYVHRDIKPGNIMWLPRKRRWTLIDFGCAAKVGERARTGFSPNYAAPEVIKAYRVRQSGMVADPAVDAWSLGILAMEMFAGQPVYNPLHKEAKTMAMIVGDEMAPWEDPATSEELLKPLGYFRKPVLSLLERDPKKRPSMDDFHQACRRILSNTTNS